MSKIFISTILAICAVAVASAQTAATTDSAQYGIIVKERFEGELFGGMALPVISNFASAISENKKSSKSERINRHFSPIELTKRKM